MISLLVAIKPNSTGVWIAAKSTETLLDNWILQKRIYEYGRFVSCTHNGFWMMYFSTFRVGILHICNRYERREVTWVCLGKHNVSLDDGHLIIFQITIGSQKKNLKFDTFGKTYWKVFVQKSH